MSNEKIFDPELFFAALADRTRLRLLNLMGDDEVCVCFLVEVIGPNQPKISRHLAYLKKAGLVSVRRDWKWAHYRVVRPSEEHAARIFDEVRNWFDNDPEFVADRRQLSAICCAPAAMQPVTIQSAPKPARFN